MSNINIEIPAKLKPIAQAIRNDVEVTLSNTVREGARSFVEHKDAAKMLAALVKLTGKYEGDDLVKLWKVISTGLYKFLTLEGATVDNTASRMRDYVLASMAGRDGVWEMTQREAAEARREITGDTSTRSSKKVEKDQKAEVEQAIKTAVVEASWQDALATVVAQAKKDGADLATIMSAVAVQYAA